MADTIDDVKNHYRATGLTDRLRGALSGLGPEDSRLTPQQLASLDHFHTRGLAATAELAELAGVTAESEVLDIGSGIGGPARFLAATYDCNVTGIDLSEPFVDAARYLTTRTGQTEQVSFEAASALDMPFGNGRFDIAMLQHVAMNIEDRTGLYREIHRVLKPGGRFATYDVVLAAGDPHYPAPWARTPATSFLLTAEGTREAIEAAGFRAVVTRDDSEPARVWAAQMREAGARPALNLGIVMGPDFAELAANLGRSLREGRLGILTAIFETVPSDR